MNIWADMWIRPYINILNTYQDEVIWFHFNKET